MEKPIKEILNADFQMEDVVHRLIIKFQSNADKSNYLSKMPTYTGIKLLSSTYFNHSLKEPQILIKNIYSNFTYTLEPIEKEAFKESSSFLWNYQHSLINSRSFQQIEKEDDQDSNKFEENSNPEGNKKIFALKSKKPLQIFEASLVKYKYLEKYDKIFPGSPPTFSNKLNEAVFINEMPLDYLVFELIDTKTKEKKGFCEVCLMDLEENILNLEFLYDPYDKIIVGTLSFMVEFHSISSYSSNNSYILQKEVNTDLMVDYDNFNKLNYNRILSNNFDYYRQMQKMTKDKKENYFVKSSKIVKLNLQIEEIWNCFELFNILEIDFSKKNVDLFCKIGNYSYSIPLFYEEIKLDKIKVESPLVYKSIINEKQMQYIEKKAKKEDNIPITSIYFLSRNKNSIICLSFQVKENFWVIIDNPFQFFSVQLIQGKNILIFYKSLIKDLLVFQDNGEIVVGLQTIKKSQNETVEFNSNCLFVKFLFKINADLEYSIEKFGGNGLYQLFLIQEEELLQKMANLDYGSVT